MCMARMARHQEQSVFHGCTCRLAAAVVPLAGVSAFDPLRSRAQSLLEGGCLHGHEGPSCLRPRLGGLSEQALKQQSMPTAAGTQVGVLLQPRRILLHGKRSMPNCCCPHGRPFAGTDKRSWWVLQTTPQVRQACTSSCLSQAGGPCRCPSSPSAAPCRNMPVNLPVVHCSAGGAALL